MDALTTITREDTKQIAARMKEALEAVAGEFGLTLELRGGTYDSTMFAPKITFKTGNADAEDWARYAPLKAWPDLNADGQVPAVLREALREALAQGVEREDVDPSWFGFYGDDEQTDDGTASHRLPSEVSAGGIQGITPHHIATAEQLAAQGEADDFAHLVLIASEHALPAAVEYDLEDRGLIVQTDQPYAEITDNGIALLRERLS